jgi:hypothetical protein
MTRVTLGKSRVRESRLPGSVRAKAKWLSYSTTTTRVAALRDIRHIVCHNRDPAIRPTGLSRSTAHPPGVSAGTAVYAVNFGLTRPSARRPDPRQILEGTY